MKRVFNSLLIVAIAMAMVGLAVTHVRADRITLKSGCLGVSCNPESLTVNSGSLSLGASSLTLDIAAVNSSELASAPDVVGGSDLSVASAIAQTADRISGAQLSGLKNSARKRSRAVPLLSNSMLWSFFGAHAAMNPTQSALSGNSHNGSFSVVAGNVASAPSMASVSAKAGMTFQANGVASSISETAPNIVGAPAVPEPTTMLLFGTGLVGAAAVLRKRLRDRREDSK